MRMRMLKRGFLEVRHVAEGWFHFECGSLAAGIAFYAALSLFPLMLVLIASVGYFFRFMQRGRNALDEILAAAAQQFSPEMSAALGNVLSGVQARALVTGPIAGIAFLFTASLVFAQLDRAFGRIWEVRGKPENRDPWTAAKRFFMVRARSFAMLMSSGLVVVLIFLAGLVLRTTTSIVHDWFPMVMNISGISTFIISLSINTLVFTFLYRFLSKERVTWKISLEAAVGVSLLWEVGSRTLSMLSFGSNLTAYGLIGSFLVVLLWIYYSIMILLLGALWVRCQTHPLEHIGETPIHMKR